MIRPFMRPQSPHRSPRPPAWPPAPGDRAEPPIAACELHDILFEGRAPGEGPLEALVDRARGAAR